MKSRLLSLTVFLPLLTYLSSPGPSVVSLRTPIEVPSVGLAPFQLAPALEVSIDGSIWLRGEQLMAAKASAAEQGRFLEWLRDFATHRDLRTLDLADDLGAETASDLLQIRVDENAPFDSVLTILEACERREVRITQLGFHVNQELSADIGLQTYSIPGAILADSLGQDWEYELHVVDVELLARVPGTKRMKGDLKEPWDGAAGSRFAYDPEERSIDYIFDEFTSQTVHWADVQCLRIAKAVESEDRDVVFRISVGSGVTFGEVFEFWQRSADSIIPYFKRSAR